MSIANNVQSVNAQRSLSKAQGKLSESMGKLSSGTRITRAADDVAGLGMSEKLRGEVKGLNQAARNGENAISMIQTAEGALEEVHGMLQRMRELAVQGSNDTLDDTDREFINVELKQLREQINNVSTSTEFNGKKLANGNLESTLTATTSTTELGMATANAGVVAIDVSNAAANTTFTFTDTATGLQLATGGVNEEIADADVTIGVDGQKTITWATHGVSVSFASALGETGANIAAALNAKTVVTGAANASATFHTGADKGQTIAVDFKNVEINAGAGDARMQQVDTGLTAFEGGTATRLEAEDLIEDLDAAIEFISETRAGYGAAQNRLESAVSNLKQTSENLTGAESRIRDVDVAEESSNMAKAQVLQQAAVSVLAQANQQPNLALKLLA